MKVAFLLVLIIRFNLATENIEQTNVRIRDTLEWKKICTSLCLILLFLFNVYRFYFFGHIFTHIFRTQQLLYVATRAYKSRSRQIRVIYLRRASLYLYLPSSRHEAFGGERERIMNDKYTEFAEDTEEPSVTSSDPNERKLARRLRIQRRQEALIK